MTAKEWLSRARTVERELAALYATREEEIARLTRSVQSLSGDPVQTSKDPHAFDRLGELAEAIESRELELRRIKADTIVAISLLRDGMERIVLHERYVNCKTFERVAVDNNVSIRNVWRIHGRALRHMEEARPWRE